MSEINFSLLQPVDVGALTQQGFATGMALVKHVQTQGALKSYLANPNDPNAYSALAALDPQAAQAIQRQEALRRQEEARVAEQQRRQSIGAQYASGDTAGARTAAIGAGDFDLVEQFGKLDDDSRKRSVSFWTAAAPLAYKLRQIADPQQRKQLFEAAKPQLLAQGADEATLSQFDPTNDTALDAVITTGQKVSDLIDQGKITWHQQGEQPSFATDSMGRPIGTQNPYAGGGASPAPSPAPAAASAVGNVLSAGGLPSAVVSGFLGNFYAEGGYGGASGDGGSASGIAQWRGERQQNFARVIGKPVTQAAPEDQAKFVLWEMQNPEAAGMTVAQRDAILAARSPAEAADLIDRFYERSSGEHRSKRVEAATRHAASGMNESQIRAMASAAIAKGADPAAVKARAKSMGIDL
jgi:hypothetical protein